MNNEVQVVRTVKPMYDGQNGFLKGFTEPEDINQHNLKKALDMRCMANFMINHKKREVPDFEAMKADVETPADDPDRINRRLKALRQEHLDDLQLLYAVQSQEYMEEAEYRYYAKDDSWLNDGPDISASQERLLEMYDELSKESVLQTQWQDHYEHLRYTYVSQLIPLEKRKQEVEANQDQLRRKREQMFPQSKADLDSKPQDVRLRAARFLATDLARQEKFLSDYGWAWRQVQPLMDIFKKDEAFAAEIRSIVLSEQAVRDPRKR